MNLRVSVQAGETLVDRYRVVRALGRGGMGVVLEVTDLKIGAKRALKYLNSQSLGSASTVERFLREARAMGRLTSEHVVRVYDVGSLPNGAPYLTMEYLEGEELGTVLKRRGALPCHEVVGYVMQACAALTEAHEGGVVHRDIKPANLFLARRGDATSLKVLDFGLSKQLNPEDHDTELTETNAVLGSPSYMSPEQIKSARDVDPRTDIWALGVVLYQLVTGRLPFAHKDPAEMVMALLGAAPPLPSTVRAGLPLALDAVVMRCLAKNRNERYASAAELAADLARFVPPAPQKAVEPVAAPTVDLEPVPSPPKERTWFSAVLVLGVLVAAVILAWLFG